MAILTKNLSNFKGLITVNSGNVNPATEDLSSDSSRFQAKLNNDRVASQELGMDFLMFAQGGLFEEEGKIKKASGIFNYGQAVTHRLMTTRGTMPGDPFFGVPWNNYLGKTYKNFDIILANLRNDIAEEVLKDSRTNEISDLQISFRDVNTIEVSLTLIPIFTSINRSTSLTIDLVGGI